MRTLVRTLAALTVLAACAPAARAQMGGPPGMESNRIVSVGLGGGVSVPVSDAADAFKSGFNGQGFIRLNLRALPIAPRLDFTFQRFDLKDVKTSGGGTIPADGNGQFFAGVANLQYFLLRGPLRPYLVAGVGAYNMKTEVSGVSKSDTRLGVNGGAGLILRLGSLASAYAEGRLDNVFTEKGVIQSDQVQMVPVTFGVVF